MGVGVDGLFGDEVGDEIGVVGLVGVEVEVFVGVEKKENFLGEGVEVSAGSPATGTTTGTGTGTGTGATGGTAGPAGGTGARRGCNLLPLGGGVCSPRTPKSP